MSWTSSTYIKYPDSKLSLGHEKLSKEEVDVVVKRLNVPKKSEEIREREARQKLQRGSEKRLARNEVESLLDRVANTEKNRRKTPERQRIGADRKMGIVNTYAWMDGSILRRHAKPADGNWH